MFTNRYFKLLFLATIFLSGAVSASAQTTAPIIGKVRLQKADGTFAPVQDAVVIAYRTDIDKGNLPPTKTNRRGEFIFGAAMLGQRFAIAVSAPGTGPRVEPNVRAGTENLVITVNEGDGRALNEAEVREVLKAASAPGGIEAASKEQQAELERKNKEIEERNRKIQEGDAIAAKANTDGQAALKANDYNLAIAKFDEGIAAVPDFIGSTPILLAGKMLALKNRGFNTYLEGAKQTDATARLAKYNAAKVDYLAALAAYDQAAAIVKAAPPATDPKEVQQIKVLNAGLFETAIEVHRLLAVSQVDTTKAGDAEKLIQEYVAFEEDPAKDAKAKQTLGDILRAAGDFDKAIAAYKSVLEVQPDNTEVMASLGLSLVGQATAVDPPNKEQMQEGLNYMQKYADTVQILSTDSKAVQEFKQSVIDTVKYLKEEQNLKPQTPARTAPRRRT